MKIDESTSIQLKAIFAVLIGFAPFVFWLFTVSASSTNASVEASRANARMDQLLDKREMNREDYLKTLGRIDAHLARIDERLHLSPEKIQ